MCVLAISMISGSLHAQNNQRSVVIGQMTSKPNAILVLNPTGDDQGFLVPQITTSARLSMTPSSPGEDGLFVFDITEKEFYYWKNGAWVKGLGSNTISDFVLKVDNKTIRLNDADELEVKDNSITTSKLLDSSVSTQKLADNSVTNLKLADNSINTQELVDKSVTNQKLADNAVNTLKLTDNSITTQKLADASVTGQKLSDNSVTTQKISDGSITAQKLANTSVTPGTYGNSSNVAQFTVDAQGRITSASNVALSGTIAPTVQYHSVDPADFSGLRPGTKKDKANALIFEDNTTFVTVFRKDDGTNLIAALHLPDGATIQGITLYYMDKDAGNMSMNIFRKQYAGTNDPVITTWNSTGNSPAVLSTSSAPIPGKAVIDNSSYSYRIVINLNPSGDANDSNAATHRIYGVQVKYLR